MSQKLPSAVKSLRTILTEWRKKSSGPLKTAPNKDFLLSLYGDNAVMQEKYCRGPREMEHLADTYATYLHSTRRAVELASEFKGKGEMSVEDSGRAVGLQVPTNTFNSSSSSKTDPP